MVSGTLYKNDGISLHHLLLLSTSHNVYTCHSPKYHYIIVTVVYLRRGSVIIFWEQFDAKYLHQVSYLFDACKKPTSIAEQVV